MTTGTIASNATERDESAEAASLDHRPEPRRNWSQLAIHVVIYSLLLATVLAGSRLNASWAADDGAYATQVRLIRVTGQWSYPYTHSDIDPTGLHVPLGNSAFDADGNSYPYAKQPVWILALLASTKLFGSVVGLYLPSALGAVAAAVVGWKLARRLGGSGAVGFWAVGAGPLLVHSTAMWAHTAAAAIAGSVALIIATIVAGRERWWHALGLVAALVALCLLRTEGTLFAAASTVVIGVMIVRRPDRWARRLAALALYSVLPLAAAAVAFIANDRIALALTGARGPWSDSIVRDVETSFLEARVFGFMRTFVLEVGSALPTALALLGLVMVLLAGRSWSHQPGSARRSVALAVSGVAMTLPRLVTGWADMAGLLPAAPLLLFGLPLSVRRRREPQDPTGALLAVASLYLVAVIATQYAAGGGKEWGGRYTFLALVPLTVIAALSIQRALGDDLTEGYRRRALAVLAVALVALPSMMGLRNTWLMREHRYRSSEQLAEASTPVVIAIEGALPRLGWRYQPGPDWLYSSGDDLPSLLATLRTNDSGAVTLVGRGADGVVAPGYTRRIESATVAILEPTA